MNWLPDVIVMHGRRLPPWYWPTHRFGGMFHGDRRYVLRWRDYSEVNW